MNDLSQKQILLLEDNDDDAFLTQRAMTKAGINGQLRRCEDGQAVIDYLQGLSEEKGPLPRKGMPHLILLDLKTPKKTGLEVLQWIREHDLYAPMVVLVLTSSSEQQDVERAYQLHVNAYLVKPTSLASMTEIAQCIKKLWLDASSLIHPAYAFPFLLGLAILPPPIKP